MPLRRNFQRKSGLRDARLIVIAAEGEVTESMYFDAVKQHYQTARLHIEILPHGDSASAPEKILQLLDKFRKTYNLQKDDQLWLLIDVDRWGDAKLAQVAQQCGQKKYQLAVSNPCFEVWFLFHVRSLQEYTTEEQQILLQNRKIGERSALQGELVRVVGIYNKAKPNMAYFLPRILTAIKNARLADTDPTTRWTNTLGTRVYLLLEEILRYFATVQSIR